MARMTAAATTLTPAAPPSELVRLQHRTLGALVAVQVVGGPGVAVGVTVCALLAQRMGGTAVSGLSQSALVVGSALLAVPVARLMTRFGRPAGLAAAYLVGALGAGLVLVGAARHDLALLLAGLFCFGGGSTAGLQARYAAVDLSSPERRGRHLSLVVWATAVGSIAGPNLVPLAAGPLSRLGFDAYAAPFLFSGVAFLIAATVGFLALRPDPLLTARALSVGTVAPAAQRSAGLRAAAREIAASPGARLGVAATTVGHAVMIAVMSLTPVHISEFTSGSTQLSGDAGHGDTLRLVGLVISAHIAGMYVLSPVTGWLTDRFGRRRVIVGGVGLLVVACAVAGTAGHGTAGLTVGLSLLGMGWSATMVAGSTLVSESVGVANRASVQGLSDLVMGLAGALAGALAGLIVAWSSYAVLTAVAAVATVPLLAAALRPSGRSA